MFMACSFRSWFYYWLKVRVQLHSFAFEFPVFSSIIHGKDCPSNHALVLCQISFALVWKTNCLPWVSITWYHHPHPTYPCQNHTVSVTVTCSMFILAVLSGFHVHFRFFFFQKCPWGFDKGHTESVNCMAKILNWLQTLFSLFLAMRFSIQFVHGSVTLILFLNPENNIYILLPTFYVNNKLFKFWP